MATVRKPFQGVGNIIRFNWHFYALAFVFLAVLVLICFIFLSEYALFGIIITGLLLLLIIVSLLVSYYVYDLSNLYSLDWLNELSFDEKGEIANIHSGFDETSILLKEKYPNATLQVFDFYNPEKHTEVSIKRARKAYPPYPKTQQIRTDFIPVEKASQAIIFLILSAHEIRDESERINFFKQCKTALKPNGKIVVLEHLRDSANFIAYTFGFFHFHSRKSWLRIFEKANFQIESESKITPFISTFIIS